MKRIHDNQPLSEDSLLLDSEEKNEVNQEEPQNEEIPSPLKTGGCPVGQEEKDAPLSETKVCESCSCRPNLPKKTTIGGQALIEGLMMVGPHKTATAFRRLDGSILVEYRDPLPPMSTKKIPIVRGAVGIVRTMIAGTRALMRAAEIQEEDQRLAELSDSLQNQNTEAEERVEKPEAVAEKARVDESSRSRSTELALYASALVGIVGGIALFVLLPNLIASWVLPISREARQSFSSGFAYNLIEGAIRMFLLLGYFALMHKLPDMKRIWQYHGAEHKTIACYEAGEPLTPENVMRQSRFHPRCGTSFLFLFVFISILLFSIVGWYAVWINLLIRLALVPLLAGLSYELLRWSGKQDKRPVCRLVARPGLWVQRLTTAEPDYATCEVAIAAMKAVIPENESDDNW